MCHCLCCNWQYLHVAHVHITKVFLEMVSNGIKFLESHLVNFRLLDYLLFYIKIWNIHLLPLLLTPNFSKYGFLLSTPPLCFSEHQLLIHKEHLTVTDTCEQIRAFRIARKTQDKHPQKKESWWVHLCVNLEDSFPSKLDCKDSRALSLHSTHWPAGNCRPFPCNMPLLLLCDAIWSFNEFLKGSSKISAHITKGSVIRTIPHFRYV